MLLKQFLVTAYMSENKIKENIYELRVKDWYHFAKDFDLINLTKKIYLYENTENE